MRREVWNTAIVQFRRPFAVDEAAPLAMFSGKGLRLPGRRLVHTFADPFLFVHDDRLFVFLEVQEVGCSGHIEAYSSIDLKTFEPLGPVFRPRFHVSYPQVFGFGGDIYMVPETSGAKEVALYRFERFPFEPRRVAMLLKGEYSDATMLYDQEKWWMFATGRTGLEIFLSSKLGGPYRPHPGNPVSSDPGNRRCGGPFLRQGGGLFRVAQDCRTSYGGNIQILRVKAIDDHRYSEEPVVLGMFDRQQSWNRLGGHHLSMTRFLGRDIAAIDGKQADYLVNRVLSPLARMLG